MWKAEIRDKKIEKGLLRVTIHYSNGEIGFSDFMETRSKQAVDWLSDGIKQRLKELEGLDEFQQNIALGDPPTLSEGTQVEATETDKEKYTKDLINFRRFTRAIRDGFTTEQQEEFIALRKKLKDNFSPDYINLF